MGRKTFISFNRKFPMSLWGLQHDSGVPGRQKIGEGLTQQLVGHGLQKNIGKHLAYFCWIFFFLSLTLDSLFCI